MTNDSNGNDKIPRDPATKPSKGKGDPVQKSARDARIKKSLRENLLRRKAKARALKAPGEQ